MKEVNPTPGRLTLKKAKSKAGTAAASVMFVLKIAEESLQTLKSGEKRAKHEVRVAALTRALEAFERASEEMQRAIETY